MVNTYPPNPVTSPTTTLMLKHKNMYLNTSSMNDVFNTLTLCRSIFLHLLIHSRHPCPNQIQNCCPKTPHTRDVRPRGLASASRPKNLASASASWVVASASASWGLASASWVLASSLEASRGLQPKRNGM